MLTIFPTDDVDYTELTKSYMAIFDTQAFYQFLNTTQTGVAHSSSGTEFSLLLKGIITSLSLCTIQLMMFCFFRNIFKSLYQPRCYCVPINERTEPLPKGFFNWILPTLWYDIHYYMSLGLDAYFFIRFINMLLLFFLIVGVLNIVVLIPINMAGSSGDFSASGLDKFSLSNISANRVYYLNAHFVMGVLTIVLFHILLVYEMETIIKIRLAFLLSPKHRESIISRTLLITNIPTPKLDYYSLNQMFSVVPGGVKKIWFVDDYGKARNIVKKTRDAVDYLEMAELKFIKSYHRYYNEEYTKELFENLLIRPYFHPPIYLKIKIPWTKKVYRTLLYGWVRIFAFQNRVDQIKWSLGKLKQARIAIEREKLKLSSGTLTKYNSVFIEFETQTGASIAHQCVLSEYQGFMDKSLIGVHPRDIKWKNLTTNNVTISLIQRYFITSLCILFIILYVIPVSFIGLISQIPLLVKLMPFLGWIYSLPEEARESISSILPSVMLSILTETMMIVFRFLTYYKGKLTGSEMELDLQKWYFGFLFIQQFLVVTILSSVTVIFKQIVDQPTSIPVMLATNIPKAAIFFFQFMAVKALTFCGNNFLRIDQLVLRHTIYPFWDKTPRMKFNRLTSLLSIRWGTTYPVYSVYASIGLTYTIISPFISIFVIFILFLVLLYYKYSLRYIHNHINVSETNGRLYPSALFHLYSGIYCLECCLVGIFFLLKNHNGEYPLRVLGWIMSFILMVTVFGNITIYNRYNIYFHNLPIIHERSEAESHCSQSLSKNSECDLNFQMLYLNPNFKYEVPKLWLPSDTLNVSQEETLRFENEGFKGSATDGATISFTLFGWFLNVKITRAPPDYK